LVNITKMKTKTRESGVNPDRINEICELIESVQKELNRGFYANEVERIVDTLFSQTARLVSDKEIKEIVQRSLFF